MKKLLVIEPKLNWPTEQIESVLTKLGHKLRLDILIPHEKNVIDQVTAGFAQNADTFVICGSAEWLESVISQSCELAHRQVRDIPVFGHITPPRNLPGLNRFPSYLENSLKNELAVIAARKIQELPLYVCNHNIWFTAKLQLHRANPESHHATVSVQTAQGSEIQLKGPLDMLLVQAETGALSRNQPFLLITGSRLGVSSQASESLLGDLGQASNRQPSEEIFRLPVHKIKIESENRYQTPLQPSEVTSPIIIKPATTSLRMIVPKNDILQY